VPILPVWLESWQLGCCGDDHEARVGQDWSGWLVIRPDAYEHGAGDVGWRNLPHGRIAFVALVVRPKNPRRARPVLDLGSCKVGLPFGIDAEGTIAGQGHIYADWHAGMGGPSQNMDVTVEGSVRRIRVYQPIGEPDSAPFADPTRLAGDEAAIDVDQTQGRALGISGMNVLLDLDLGLGASPTR
jgi:hypothetical protein